MGATVAVIPARGGSKGVPGKNLRAIGGVPLVGRAILAAIGSQRVSDVYVSSDDSAILDVSQQFGARPILRPAAISGDTASSEAALLHALAELRLAGSVPDRLVFIQCTSPFVTAEEVASVVAGLDDPRFSVALSVAEDHSFLWAIDDEGAGRGVNHDHTQPRARRQDLPPQYRETGAVYALRVADFLRVERRFCGPVRLVPTKSWPIEIDTPADLRLADQIAASEGFAPPIPAQLSAIKVLVTDFDGVHTDDTVFVNQDGVESVRCSRSDGLGMEMLRNAGVDVLILTKETNPVSSRRAEKLRVEIIHSSNNKLQALTAWLSDRNLGFGDIAYVGNDVNDLECLQRAGAAFVPSDAHQAVRSERHYVLQNKGGRGAIREICDLILAARAT